MLNEGAFSLLLLALPDKVIAAYPARLLCVSASETTV